jgi:hypothetical protein
METEIFGRLPAGAGAAIPNFGRLNQCDSHVETPVARGEISEPNGRPGSTDRSSTFENTLTVFDWPSVRLHSQYGFIPFGDWCALEVERINAGGRKKLARVVSGDGYHTGQIAVAVQML